MQNPEVVSDEDLTKPQSLSTLVAQLLEMIDIGRNSGRRAEPLLAPWETSNPAKDRQRQQPASLNNR